MQTQVKKQNSIKPFKIFIGGSQLSKFKSEEQIENAKKEIRWILGRQQLAHRSGKNFVVLSGHCPVGEERWYCTTCGMWLTEDKIGEANQDWYRFHLLHNHKVVKVFDKGGVDTWVEQECAKLDIKVELHPAGVKAWEAWECVKCVPIPQGVTILSGKIGHLNEEKSPDFLPILKKKFCPIHPNNKEFRELNGYKIRNLAMTVADIGYAIDAKGSCWHCGGTGSISRHLLPKVKLIGEKGDCYYRYWSS